MATHYTSTTQTVKVKDYAYGGSSWAEISLAVTIAANGAVSYTASCNHSASGQWQYKGLIITLNGTTIANNNYYSSASECEADFGKGSRFPINDDSSYSGTAGTASGGSVSYTMKLNCQSDGGVHGWSGSESNNYKGTTVSGSISRNYWTDNTAGGKPTITDSGNNNFSITGNSGTAGSSNSITETKLQYKIGSATSWTTDGDNSYSGTVTANTTYTARTRYKCSHGGDSSGYLYSAESSKTIYFYKAPGDVGKPALTAASFKNGRLTIKQNWTYTWTAASAGSTASPVLGYRIRMYKNGSLVKGITAGSGSNISKGTGTNEYLDRSGSTNCSITFNPVSFGFAPGDTIYIGVFAWAKNGAGSVLWSGNGSAHVTSDTTTVQNSGIMRVRPAGSWKEGVVSVKVNDTWIEADVVQIKADGNWKESE